MIRITKKDYILAGNTRRQCIKEMDEEDCIKKRKPNQEFKFRDIEDYIRGID